MASDIDIATTVPTSLVRSPVEQSCSIEERQFTESNTAARHGELPFLGVLPLLVSIPVLTRGSPEVVSSRSRDAEYEDEQFVQKIPIPIVSHHRSSSRSWPRPCTGLCPSTFPRPGGRSARLPRGRWRQKRPGCRPRSTRRPRPKCPQRIGANSPGAKSAGSFPKGATWEPRKRGAPQTSASRGPRYVFRCFYGFAAETHPKTTRTRASRIS